MSGQTAQDLSGRSLSCGGSSPLLAARPAVSANSRGDGDLTRHWTTTTAPRTRTPPSSCPADSDSEKTAAARPTVTTGSRIDRIEATGRADPCQAGEEEDDRADRAHQRERDQPAPGGGAGVQRRRTAAQDRGHGVRRRRPAAHQGGEAERRDAGEHPIARQDVRRVDQRRDQPESCADPVELPCRRPRHHQHDAGQRESEAPSAVGRTTPPARGPPRPPSPARGRRTGSASAARRRSGRGPRSTTPTALRSRSHPSRTPPARSYGATPRTRHATTRSRASPPRRRRSAPATGR